MRYYKNIEADYIMGIGTGSGGEEITQEEYENLLSVIRNRPSAEPGYDYRLKADLSWELCEAPEVEEELESTEDDYIAALAELGVEL